MMKILLIGREGQVAWEFRRTLGSIGEVIAIDRRSDSYRIDLADSGSIASAIVQIRPQLVINAAAYTAVDRAEQEADLAHQINGVAPGIIAKTAQAVGAGIIHFSTDYVFDGTATEPYTEEAITHPQSVYGESKLEGEIAIRKVDVEHLILRTAWVYGGRGHNFLLTMLQLMKQRKQLNIVDDQHGAPTWSRMIAECTAQMIVLWTKNGKFAPGNASGIYHVTCGGQTTWYGFARKIVEIAKRKGILNDNCAEVFPIPTKDYPTPAKRPAYSVLSNEKLLKSARFQLPHWEESLELCLDEYSSGVQRIN